MNVHPVLYIRAIIPILIMFILIAVETISDISAVKEGGLGS